jgi:hypothetical protein
MKMLEIEVTIRVKQSGKVLFETDARGKRANTYLMSSDALSGAAASVCREARDAIHAALKTIRSGRKKS